MLSAVLNAFLFVCRSKGLVYACQDQEKKVTLIGQIKVLK